jgi:hypothetical protein
MTSVGPFSQTTLLFEPTRTIFRKVATPRTILDYVTKNLPHFLPVIKKAGKLPFFNNDAGYRYTLFVPLQSNFSKTLDANIATKIVNMSTVPGIITTDMFSNNQIVYPLGKNNLRITKNQNGSIKVNENLISRGNIRCTNGIIHLIDGSLCPVF